MQTIFRSKPKKKKPGLKAKLDRVFSLYIRSRDSKQFDGKYFRCISCGEIKTYEQADCGHYINRSIMATRYDEINCNAQCRKCNRFTEGNIQDYRKGLIVKYGIERVEILEMKKHNTAQFNDAIYEELIKYYNNKIKELKS